MARPDETCELGIRCAARTVGGLAGRAVPHVGMCVLCCRRTVTEELTALMFHGSADDVHVLNPYCNLEGDYGVADMVDPVDKGVYRGVTGPFVVWNPRHYRVLPGGGVEQTLARPEPTSWLETLFHMEWGSGADRAPPWAITVCVGPRCRGGPPLTYVNVSMAEGAPTAVDLDAGRILCVRCKVEVIQVRSHPGSSHMFLEYGGKWYARCAFCNTVVEFNKFRCPQACDSCRAGLLSQARASMKVCFYCSVPVGPGRRGGAQELLVDDKVTYLCRQHRIRGSRRNFTEEELQMMLR
jgi:hypothetical protein